MDIRTFDMYRRIGEDRAFYNRLKPIIVNLEQAQLHMQQHVTAQKAFQQLFVMLLRTCDYNPGLIVPYCFPKYPRDQPLSLMARPFSFMLLQVVAGGYLAVRAGRQIAKSTGLILRQILYPEMNPGWRSLYVAPHQSFLDTYKNRFRELERAYRFYKPGNPNVRKNLTYKEHDNGSLVQLVKCMSESIEARSKSADEVLFDEYQLFNSGLEADILQTMKSSSVQARAYTGTSTTLDSPLEYRFQEGSRGVLLYKCGCGQLTNCSSPEDVLKMTQPLGMTCPKCSRMINGHKFRMEHEDEAAFREHRISIHVPQFAIPAYGMDPTEWRSIYEVLARDGEIKYLTEIAGIPQQESDQELTEKDLVRACVLDDLTDELVMERIRSGYYRYLVSGCDWGGSDHDPVRKIRKSYTVHCVIGYAPDNFWDVLHFRRHSGMNMRTLAANICADHARFRCTAIGTDFGGGNAYNMMLRENAAVREDNHMIFDYTTPSSQVLAPMDGWRNQWGLNRTESLSTVFRDINSEPPRLRFRSWATQQGFLRDFLNLRRIIADTPGGKIRFRYHLEPSKTDDCLHALNLAYVTGRVMTGEPLISDPQASDRIRRMLTGQAIHTRSSNGKRRLVAG